MFARSDARPSQMPVRTPSAPGAPRWRNIEPELQPSLLPRTGGETATEAPPIVHLALRGPGAPLDARTQTVMEQRLGADFSHVRVHTDERAAASARAVDAVAYTVGSSIVFGEGRYSPNQEEGRNLLAHELVHTLQQGRTRAPVSSGPLTIESPESAMEDEARAIAGASEASALGRRGLPRPNAAPVKVPLLPPAAAPMVVARQPAPPGPAPSPNVLNSLAVVGGAPVAGSADTFVASMGSTVEHHRQRHLGHRCPDYRQGSALDPWVARQNTH